MALTTLTRKKSTPASQTVEGLRVMCQVDLYTFAREVLYKHLGAANHVTPAVHGPLCTHLQTTPYDENLYLMARGFFKSALITTANNIQRVLADPAAWWCQRRWRGRTCGPNTRILIASNKGENAQGMLAGIKGHLESNDLLIGLFPHILVQDPARQATEWTQEAITVQRSRRDLRESTIQTIGVTGELVSKHYDHGTFDDIVGRENSQTRAEREKVVDFADKSRPLFDPGATRDYVGTPWHYADYWMQLKALRARGAIALGLHELAAWRPCAPETPGGADVPGHGWREPTFPERFCMVKTAAEDPRLSLVDEWRRSPSNFNAQYLLDPVSAETAHLPRVDHAGVPYLQLEDAPPALGTLWVAMTVDPAISVQTHADYSAIAVGGFDRRGDLWLLELWHARRDDESLVRQIYELHARFPMIRVIGFEAVGFSRTYRHVITIEGDRRGYYLPIRELPRDTNRTKQIRIGGLQGPWMSRQIHALRSCQALAAFQDEADKFRTDQENDHDDLLDAVVDLYEVRARPSAPVDPFLSDEAIQRVRWEEALRQERPALDALSARVAWLHQDVEAQAQAADEGAALRGGVDGLTELGR